MSNGDTVFTSSNGQFTLSVTDNGIWLNGPVGRVAVEENGVSLTGPAGSIEVGVNGVTVNGALITVQSPQTSFLGTIKFPDGVSPVARVGDLTDSGSVQGGNPNVLV